jgi:hypothetical protein
VPSEALFYSTGPKKQAKKQNGWSKTGWRLAEGGWSKNLFFAIRLSPSTSRSLADSEDVSSFKKKN